MEYRRITAKAPARIDFAGGWTDTPPYSTEKGGSVVNAAITLYMNTELRLYNGYRLMNVLIRAVDYDETVESEDIASLEFDGRADFLKAALKSLPVDCPIEIITSSDIPAGSGLGGSGSLGVAMTAALTLARGEFPDDKAVPEKARDIEVEKLGILGGKQDQYTAMFGGFRYLTFKDPDVNMLPLPMLKTTVDYIKENSVLAYTGQSRVSGDIHRNVVEAYHAGCRETLKALDIIKSVADEMKDALISNDLEGFASLLNKNWDAQKSLHPSVTNETIERAFALALNQGAIAGKALGAGGGGCIYFFCLEDSKRSVEEAIKDAGCISLPFDFDFRGLVVEKE